LPRVLALKEEKERPSFFGDGVVCDLNGDGRCGVFESGRRARLALVGRAKPFALGCTIADDVLATVLSWLESEVSFAMLASVGGNIDGRLRSNKSFS
jgi:hypothetical protein